MREKIKEKLKELEGENWPTQWLSGEKIEELAERIRNRKITIWYNLYGKQDAHSYLEFNLSPSMLEYDRLRCIRFVADLQEELDFWEKYGKEEYLLLTIELSLYKKFFTSCWDIIPTINKKAAKDILEGEDIIKNRELEKDDFEKIHTPGAEVSGAPPNEECKIFQEKIIKILEEEGFVYVTPEECDEKFNEKKLYDILFAYI